MNAAAGPAAGFPWDAVMAFGLGRLRLSPADFWAMTPRELAAAADGVFGTRAEPLGRSGLKALMARFPDDPIVIPGETGRQAGRGKGNQ